MPLGDVIGHHRLVGLLGAAVNRDRVPQSLLFAGPAGVGKRTTAVALAQALNCQARRNVAVSDGTTILDACGVCAACQRIARGQHTDVTIIDRGEEASIKIKRLRERLLEVVGYRPFEARKRLFVIDPADELTTEAQDALLKTLEEPPASAILILVSAYPDTLLATIQSRCRRVRFGPLSEHDVARVLAERLGMDRASARLLAAGAGGSVSRALADEAGDVADDRDAALELLQASAGRTVGARLKAAAALAQHKSKRRDREALGARLALLSALCRDATALSVGAPAAVTNTDLMEPLAELSRAFGPERLARAFETVDQAQRALERYASPKLVADWVGVRI
jgi:DNA polymerase-3 subunit delta'